MILIDSNNDIETNDNNTYNNTNNSSTRPLGVWVFSTPLILGVDLLENVRMGYPDFRISEDQTFHVFAVCLCHPCFC